MNTIIGKTIWLFATSILIFLLTTTAVNGGPKHKISGTIADDSNRVQCGIAVVVYRADEEIGSDESNHDGSYEIEFDPGGPIDEIIYEKNGWNPDSIYNLSGQKGHIINKVIYRWGSPLSKAQISGYVGAVSKLYSVSAAKGLNQRKFFAEVVGLDQAVPIVALAKMPIPIYELGFAVTKKEIKKNIFDFISKDVSFTIWKQLAKVAKFEKDLENKGPFTIILPIDSAFSALSPDFLLEAKSSKNIAQEAVFPYIIQGEYDFKLIKKMGYAKTLDGTMKINVSQLKPIVTDIRAKNGLIHVVGNLYPQMKNRWDWKQ
jgi:uncharacterized surface protein with fasciclin (FAS1) repeats